MKKYLNLFLILTCLLISLLCTGCTCVCKDEEIIFTIEDYVNVNGETCIKYVEADKTLIGRDKEVFRARQRKMKDILNKYFKKN